MARRVVVTGLGVLSPLGLTVEDTWKNVLAAKSGISLIHNDDPHFVVNDESILDALNTQIYGKVNGLNVEECIDPKLVKKTGEFIHYGMIASAQALNDAGLLNNLQNPERAGVAVGAGIGGLEVIVKGQMTMATKGPRRVSPFFIPGSIINMLPGQISIEHGFKGPNISVVSACTTGAHNIGFAHRMIQYGDADVMIAGGAEMASIAIGMVGFANAKTLSRRNDAPEKASRPWDKGRDGFVLSEGAAILILESEEHAKARGARIYAELTGFGMSADAYHMTSPSGDGGVRSMQNALNDAKLAQNQIGYINAHATSTPAGDLVEVEGIKQVFGDHAYQLAVSSTKSMTGHLLGAAGSLEAVFSVLALRDQVCPPTINLDEPDEGCDLDFVRYQTQERALDHVLSNSFGFGGTNGSLVFSKYQG